MAEAGTGEGRLQLFVAIDRTCKYVHAEVHGKKPGGRGRGGVSSQPDRRCFLPDSHGLTDNGVRFTNRRRDRRHAAVHEFGKGCRESGVEHRLTKVYHPWTNGKVERIYRTLGEATVKLFFYDSHEQFREYLGKFPDAYNFARHLGVLRGRTPFEEISNWWGKEPERFIIEPGSNTLVLNT